MRVQVSVLTYVFLSLGALAGSGIALSDGNSMFNIFRSCQTVLLPRFPSPAFRILLPAPQLLTQALGLCYCPSISFFREGHGTNSLGFPIFLFNSDKYTKL